MLQCTAVAFATGLAVLAAACADDAPACRVGADCPTGACGADGRCVVDDPTTTSSSTGGSSVGGGATSSTASSGGAGVGGGTGGTGLCSPDGDGVIRRDEIPLGPGLSAKFTVAQDATFDTGGTAQNDGSYAWDLAQSFAGDHLALIETLPLAGEWFEPSFPGASYAAKLRDGDDLLGVFELTPTALLLRGVVSPEDGPFRTELAYDPPVTILAFPFAEGDDWVTVSDVSGLAIGVFSFYTETYTSTVDKHGTMSTPFGEFPVLRVHTDLERVIGLATTHLQTHVFVTECFGTVASVASQDGETSVEFSDVAELRRLAP